MNDEERAQILQLIEDIRDMGYVANWNNPCAHIEVMHSEFDDWCHAILWVKDGKVMGEFGDKNVEICGLDEKKKLEEHLENL